MDDIRISVILPVYGVEKYIGQCIETLKAQKLDGLEFLFIDDCSPDGSAAIVEAAAAEDGRFHLIRQPRNGGPGAARNTGIEIARGKYLSFADPDDWMAPDFYGRLWAAAEKHPEWDIVKGKVVYIEDETSERVPRWEKINSRIRRQLSVGRPLYLTSFHDHQSALFKAEVLKDKTIRYGSSRMGEDTTFLLRFCLKTQKIGFADDAVYYYRGRRPGAATAVFSEARLHSEFMSIEEKAEALGAYGFDENALRYIRKRFYNSMTNYCLAERDHPDLKENEASYIALAQNAVKQLPCAVQLPEDSPELQLLMDWGVLVPYKRQDHYIERISRWTDFVCSHPDAARKYRRDYALMMLQSVYAGVFNKRSDLSQNGYFRSVRPHWKRLPLGFRAGVILWMFPLIIKAVCLVIIRRIKIFGDRHHG